MRNNMQFPWKQMRFVEGQGQAKHLDIGAMLATIINPYCWGQHKNKFGYYGWQSMDQIMLICTLF